MPCPAAGPTTTSERIASARVVAVVVVYCLIALLLWCRPVVGFESECVVLPCFSERRLLVSGARGASDVQPSPERISPACGCGWLTTANGSSAPAPVAWADHWIISACGANDGLFVSARRPWVVRSSAHMMMEVGGAGSDAATALIDGSVQPSVPVYWMIFRRTSR